MNFDSVFADPVTAVATAVAVFGGLAGGVGAFAVVRRQSLQGDAVAHAALPGIAAAFLLGARSPALLLFGAAVSGWVALLLVAGIVRRSRVPFDAALGGTLAVFFGVGSAVLTYVQKNVPAAANNGLDRYLFGSAATLQAGDVYLAAGVGAAAVLVVSLLWKEWKLASFDPDFAAALGFPVRLLDTLLTTLIVVAVVVGLQAVGVVLMSTLLVAPATAARQWTDRFGRMTLLAATFGAAAGLGGVTLAVALSGPGRGVPTGPTIVLTATALAVASILFAPRGGGVWRAFARKAAA